MPNGGSDCCGTCWFNEANDEHGQPRDGARAYCVIRHLHVDEPYWTYCANHPHHNPDRLQVPVGPAYGGKGEERWPLAPPPPTSVVQDTLMHLLANIPEVPQPEYIMGMSRDETVVAQAGESCDARAVPLLERIAGFDPRATSSEGLAFPRGLLVAQAKESLVRLLSDLRQEPRRPRDIIRFYHTRRPWGCFSNFSRHPVVMDEYAWLTTEHWFQAQKFAGTEHAHKVRWCETPRQAAAMGRDRSLPLRADWEQVKDDIMRQGVWAKFTQHARLAAILLRTGDAHLVEHTQRDDYWGDGGDGAGRNRLGEILMETRRRLRSGQ